MRLLDPRAAEPAGVSCVVPVDRHNENVVTRARGGVSAGFGLCPHRATAPSQLPTRRAFGGGKPAAGNERPHPDLYYTVPIMIATIRN